MAKTVAMQFESRKTSLTILLLPFLLSFLSPAVSSAYMQTDDEEGLAPWDQWDQDDGGNTSDGVDSDSDASSLPYPNVPSLVRLSVSQSIHE